MLRIGRKEVVEILWFWLIIILSVVAYVASKILNLIFRPVKFKPKKEIYVRNPNASKESMKNMLENGLRLVKDFAVIGEESAHILEQDIRRLDLETTAKKVRQTQVLYALIALASALFVFLIIDSTLGSILFGVVYFAWTYPIKVIKYLIKERNEAIIEEFPKFYSLVYNTYRHNNTTDFKELVEAYIPNAKPLFALELKSLLEDLHFNGDAIALKLLKKRVPLGLITRFCELLEARLDGVDNLSAMENFKSEMDEKKYSLVEEFETLKQTQFGRIRTLLFIPLGLLVAVYFVVQFSSALGGFTG